MSEKAPAWVGVTYLLYIVAVLIVCLGGTGYAVFVLGHSGCWLLAGFLLCGCGYSPAKWHSLWTGVEPVTKDEKRVS